MTSPYSEANIFDGRPTLVKLLSLASNDLNHYLPKDSQSMLGPDLSIPISQPLDTFGLILELEYGQKMLKQP